MVEATDKPFLNSDLDEIESPDMQKIPGTARNLITDALVSGSDGGGNSPVR